MPTIYHVTATSHSPDARAIVDRVNTVTASNGDSLYRDRVQAELDEIITKMARHGSMSAVEIVELYGLTVEAEEVEEEE